MYSIRMNQSLEEIRRNRTYEYDDEDSDNDYLYDRSDVRVICVILYSIVFIAGFLGNLIVIVVVTIHSRMRSITNFCLANLAFADFCVSIFCIYQNMYIYFMSSWVFGAFLCKMYYFMTELSHTASILILVVICIERYLAIVHPMRCKEWLTLTRLRATIVGVWSISAIYSSPRLFFTNIGTMPLNDGEEEILCIPIRTLYDSETFDMISLVVLFVLPLLVISILYTRIGLALWESSKSQMQQPYFIPNSTSAQPVLAATASTAPERESYSSSDQNQDQDHDFCYEEVKHLSINQHSCTDIICCGCEIFQMKFPKQNQNHRSIGHRKIGRRLPAFENGTRQRRQVNFHNGQLDPAGLGQGHRQSRSSPIPIPNSTSTEPKPIVVVKFENQNYQADISKSKWSSNCNHNRIRNKNCCTISFNDRSPAASPSPIPSPAVLPNSKICKGNENEIVDFVKENLNSKTTPDANANRNMSLLTVNPDMAMGTSPTSSTRRIKRLTVTRGGKYGNRAIETRRSVIKMLIIIVVAFAVCNFPFHARKIWQYYGSGYNGGSTFSSIFTPVTFLIMYANSGINPFLYAFMSKKFQACFMDLLNCKLRRSLCVGRNTSVRSTHIIPISIHV